MAGTKFERLEIGGPDVAIFKVSGKLGFHENLKIKKLTGECLKRKYTKVIFDFSELSSLGGGVAKILREFVGKYKEFEQEVIFVVTNDIVIQFLQDDNQSVTVYRSLSDAIGQPVEAGKVKQAERKDQEDRDTGEERLSDKKSEAGNGEADAGAAELKIEKSKEFAIEEESGGYQQGGEDGALVDNSGVILMSYDGEIAQQADKDEATADTHEGPSDAEKVKDAGDADTQEESAAGEAAEMIEAAEALEEDETAEETKEKEEEKPPAAPQGQDAEKKQEESPDNEKTRKKTTGKPKEDTPAKQNRTEQRPAGERVFTEIFGEKSAEKPPDWIDKPTSPFSGKTDESVDTTPERNESAEQLNKRLKRRILEFKTLFSISAEFNTIRDRKKLIDIFLLTSIAQGGVESAVFFEKKSDVFEPAIFKGLGHDNVDGLKLSTGIIEEIQHEYNVVQVGSISMSKGEKKALKKEGLEYLCPFRQKGELAGLVLLGQRIAGRGMKEEDFEFLKILINVAQSAYENAAMFESEHERTLGIVKTLISLIEENTLVKGSSEFVSRYVGMVAKNMDYAEEHFKDLIYGTVLRDMGMIKVSDLILRSPRELTKEEWEIIKRHPEDGAEMLERMKFSDHIVEIVKTHHERFNGEGYPLGLRGKDIPVGSRIISVVESYDAMIHERPNRPALSEKEALDTLKENYGLRYDREVVAQFAKIVEKEIAKSIKPKVSVT